MTDADRDRLIEFVKRAQAAQRKVDEILARPSFTCPTCGRTSYNPTDVREQYCGHCHTFPEDRP